MAKEKVKEIKQEAKTFFGSLFDFSFSSFITTKLIKLLFGAGIVLGGLAGIVSIIGAFSTSVPAGLLALAATPVVYLLGVIVLRIWLELVMILFRVEENTRK